MDMPFQYKFAIVLCFMFLEATGQEPIEITHGPILGHLTHNSLRVWGRTSSPGSFLVVFQKEDSSGMPAKILVNTTLSDDNTGWGVLTDLEPDTKYRYYLQLKDEKSKMGSFRTLPHTKDFIDKGT